MPELETIEPKTDQPDFRPTCPDCSAAVGHAHTKNCDVARCPLCKGQRLSCGCLPHQKFNTRVYWTGFWPGVLDCRTFGWYAVMVPGKGWQSCLADIPGATEDLNRWSVWNQTGQDTLYKERQ